MKRALATTTKRLFVTPRRSPQWVPSFRPRVLFSALSSTNHRNFSSESNSNNSNKSNKSRPDPFARRPNKICDPYGQGGKPLTAADAERLLMTVHPDWSLRGDNYHNNETLSTSSQNNETDATAAAAAAIIPTELTRSFAHPDFMSGSAFLNQVAAVAQMNDHFPSLKLERKLDPKRKQWRVVSTVTCHTFVLQGLSHHDFFIATVRSFIFALSLEKQK